MYYSDIDRLIHYEGNVDIKQGTDRMTSGLADVYLTKETNEMEKTVAQRNVVLTQPNRKGTGDWVEFTSASEIAVLKGNPARVDDVEQGNTEGNRLTLSMKEGKVTADDARARHYFESSVGMATVLNPVIGYEAAAKVAQESARSGETIVEVVRRMGLLTDEQIARLFDPRTLTEPRDDS
jgi:lipopolysaccharide transport protein LptA